MKNNLYWLNFNQIPPSQEIIKYLSSGFIQLGEKMEKEGTMPSQVTPQLRVTMLCEVMQAYQKLKFPNKTLVFQPIPNQGGFSLGVNYPEKKDELLAKAIINAGTKTLNLIENAMNSVNN